MLIYDGDCGFCTAAVTRIKPLLRTPITVIPSQEVRDLAALELGPDDVATAVYWVDAYGRRSRGHEAVARLLLQCRSPWPALGAVLLVPPISWLAALGYLLVARARNHLPGATAGCRIPPRPADPRAGAEAGPAGVGPAPAAPVAQEAGTT